MTRSRDESALPWVCEEKRSLTEIQGGLSKREFFALWALHGQLTCNTDRYGSTGSIAKESVNIADNLIRELSVSRD